MNLDRRAFRTALLCSAVSLTPVLRAQSTWTGATSNDWNTATNWTPTGVPSGSVVVNNATPAVVSTSAIANTFSVGAAVGEASVTVQSGALLYTSGTASIGSDAGTTGKVTVTDPNSTWWNLGPMTLGANGTGALNVTNGAKVNQVTFSFSLPGIPSTPDFIVGNAGVGTMTISSGGSLTAGGAGAVIGGAVGGVGSVTVKDAGSNWQAGTIYVGKGGQGSLTVLNGATVNGSGSIGYDGTAGGGTGAVTITEPGSTWNSGTVLIGRGDLTIANGGSVSSTVATLGELAGATATAHVTGPGATLRPAGPRRVGWACLSGYPGAWSPQKSVRE